MISAAARFVVLCRKNVFSRRSTKMEAAWRQELRRLLDCAVLEERLAHKRDKERERLERQERDSRGPTAYSQFLSRARSAAAAAAAAASAAAASCEAERQPSLEARLAADKQALRACMAAFVAARRARICWEAAANKSLRPEAGGP